ncbi:hypothetical protein GV51_0420 [Gardnerella vaginalis 5-1]|nr:hypothetical protein GV51_0420 [Gardnerella vaginalis 5-1]
MPVLGSFLSHHLPVLGSLGIYVAYVLVQVNYTRENNNLIL